MYSDSPPAAPAAVLLGDRQPEGAHLAEPGDDVLGDVGVVPVDVLGDGLDLVLGEAPEGVLHQLEVLVEVAGPGRGGEVGEGGRVAALGDEGAGGVERAGVDAPDASRPQRRAPRSATASATKAQVIAPSTSPLAP